MTGGKFSPVATNRKRLKGDLHNFVNCSVAQPHALQGRVRMVPSASQLPWSSFPMDSQSIAAMVSCERVCEGCLTLANALSRVLVLGRKMSRFFSLLLDPKRCTYSDLLTPKAISTMMASTEDLPLLRHKVFGQEDAAHMMSCYCSSSSRHEEEVEEELSSSISAPSSTNNYERQIKVLKTGFMHVVCILLGYLLNTSYIPLSSLIRYNKTQYYSEQSSIKILGRPKTTEPPEEESTSSSYHYTQVQTISFQIYTGGAPAFINTDDESSTSDKKKENNVHQNPECKGCESNNMCLIFITQRCYCICLIDEK